MGVLEQNVGIVRKFTPMSATEREALRRRVAPQAGDWRLELYKITAKFEGPAGREQHGFPEQGRVPD